MVAWTVEAEHQLLLLALKQAPKFVIDPDHIIAEWAGADKPTVRSVRDRFNMLRRKSGGNDLTVAGEGASTPATAITPALGSGSAKRKISTASNIITPSKHDLSDTLGTSKMNGHNISGVGVAIQDLGVGDDIIFPLTPTSTTETKKPRRRSYTRRPPGSSTAFIDMDPAHFPAPPDSSPAPVGEAVVKSEIQDSESFRMSEAVNGPIAATPGSIGDGPAVKTGGGHTSSKADINTPSRPKSKLKRKVKGEVNGNDKISGKTNARNVVVTNSITNSTKVAKPTSITRGSGSGSGNSNNKRKASHLSSSSPSDSDDEEAMSSDARSSISEFKGESGSDTSGDDILTASKSKFQIKSNASTSIKSGFDGGGKAKDKVNVNRKVNLNGKADANGNANDNNSKIDNDFTTALSASATTAATPRESLPRRSKSITTARAYLDNRADSDEKIGVLGDRSGTNDGVGVADGDDIGSGLGRDVSDDEMDLDFNIDADFDFEIAVDDDVDSDIDVDEKEWFGEMGFDAKGKGLGKAIGNRKPSWKGRIGSVKGKSGNWKKGWRERVTKFEV